MESLIKPIVRVGNSAGVVLPLEWYGGEARIELIRKPLNIKEDILRILKDYLGSVLGVYIVGSYARGEQKAHSDVDVLAITSNVNKKIVNGKYDILLISMDEVKKALKIIVPIVPMVKEAIPLINKQLLDEIKNIKINKESLKWHIETTKSSLKILRGLLDLGDEKIDGDLIYPLILRLREVYIVDCLLKNKKYRKKDFLQILKRNKIYELYEGYEDEKKGKKAKSVDKEKAEVAYRLVENYI